MLLYPSLRAAAIESPIVEDFPRPLAALRDMVVLLLLSIKASTNEMITFAWSKVFVVWIKFPITYFLDKSFFIF